MQEAEIGAMARDDTPERAGAERSALVALSPASRPDRVVGGRPQAAFLTQLIVGADPSLRPGRLDRTRAAAALYATTSSRR